MTIQISFTKTIVGWFNVTLVDTGAIYNVSPDVLHGIAVASPNVVLGCAEINGAQLVKILTDCNTRCITRQTVEVAI
ncbi:hypothetical protein [Sporosarcina sp. SAFN-010]|uniref:hypothetical protein n=1 Tax=Sporosarcina sp. SAFN-010 TaxID=3387273 RepID=UPI003F822E57